MRVLSTRLYTVGIALEGLIGGGQHTRRSLRPAAAIACLAAFLFVIGWVSRPIPQLQQADTNCSDLGYGASVLHVVKRWLRRNVLLRRPGKRQQQLPLRG